MNDHIIAKRQAVAIDQLPRGISIGTTARMAFEIQSSQNIDIIARTQNASLTLAVVLTEEITSGDMLG